MAKSQSDTLRTGDFIEAVYPRHSKNRRTDQGTYLSLDMAPLFASTLDPFMAAFRFYRPPSSFTTFALLSREQTVEIDKIRALLACLLRILTRWKRSVNKAVSVLGFYTPRWDEDTSGLCALDTLENRVPRAYNDFRYVATVYTEAEVAAQVWF